MRTAFRLHRANQAEGLAAEVESLRQARSQLEVALRAEQRRAQEWYAQASAAAAAAAGGAAVVPPGGGPSGSSPSRSAAAADKKRDEVAVSGVYDPESAVLQVGHGLGHVRQATFVAFVVGTPYVRSA